MMLTDVRSGARAINQPRVVQLQISRYNRTLPRAKDPLEFLVALHVEGTSVTWQRNAVLERDDEQRLIVSIDGLRRWSAGLGLTKPTAQAAVDDIGRTLRDTFLGSTGRTLLAELDRTALLLMVDETILHLPWEMMFDSDDRPLVLGPFGRVVTTRVMSEVGRDLPTEDPIVRILAVENPTDDLAGAERVMDAINALGTTHDDLDIRVTTLARSKATRRGFAAAINGHDYDIIHFAGHGRFDARQPTDGALQLADGTFTDEEVLNLRWARPPFVVVNGSCESARTAPGVRIVSNKQRSNGLAAAFLSRGVEAYLGHYFFVDDSMAADFSDRFYSSLLRERNVGRA
ncbi:MAG: CHAT domain-containing protein, partial [Ilumatobacteraceae bacterium]